MTSGEERKLLLVVGCQRSGTTWLQLLLAQHPSVATHNETFLFFYLHRLRERWVIEQARPRIHRDVGLTRLLSGEEFDALCREFASRVLDKIADARPGAHVVLEKTPDHILYWETILALFPDAYVLHVIRDPRSVAASLLAASQSEWGDAWAPTSVRGAAERWRAAIEAGRALAAKAPHYREVRYEALTADTAGEVGEIFAWLGVPCAPDFAAQAAAACRIDNLRKESIPVSAPWTLAAEPEGFFRRGETEGWRTELTRAQVRELECRLGDLMPELGYAPISPRPAVRPMGMRARDAVESVRWRLRRWLD